MKNTIKRAVALALMLVMALSLCACGDGGAKSEENIETPAYVYNTEFKTILTDSERSLSPREYTANGFYAVSYEKIGEREPYEGEVGSYEGQFDIYGSVLYFVDFSGAVSKLSDYTRIDAQQLLEDPEYAPEGYDPNNVRDLYFGSDLYALTVTDDGKLITIDNAYISYNNAPEDVAAETEEYYEYYNYTSVYFIRTLDKNGVELSRAVIDLDEDEYIYASTIVLDENNNVMVGGERGVVVIGLDGSIVARITDESSNAWVDSIVKLSDGRIAATVYGENGVELRILDTASQSYGETLPLPPSAYSLVVGCGGNYDAYYTNGTNFFGIKFAEDGSSFTEEKLFNWINCDISSDTINRILVREDGGIVTVINDYDSSEETYEVTLATVSLVPYDSVPHKQELTLATQYLDWNVRNEIVAFNRKNENYRVVVKDYSEYNTEEDYSAGLTKLTTEIMAGEMPDILDLSGLPYTQLAAKGLLTDLYPFIDSDGELSRDDFFANVLESREVNGALYSTLGGFSIETVIGATSVVGDRMGWTYDDLYNALALMRESVPECEVFGLYTTSPDILRSCLMLDMNKYVNWATGEVNFDCPEFVDLLNFAATFPDTFDENYEYSASDSQQNRIADGRQMLMQMSIFSLDSLGYYDYYFGGDVSYIGLPTSDGRPGNLISLNTGFAISEKSENKEAAWSFLRTFLTEKYQSDESKVYELPSNLGAFNKRLKKVMTPDYRTDADGNYILDEDGNKIEIPKMSIGTENGTVDVYAFSQEQADKLIALITSTTAVADYGSDSIFEIVSEQSQAFFAGQKSAEEVAKLVQSKANIYVNEQR